MISEKQLKDDSFKFITQQYPMTRSIYIAIYKNGNIKYQDGAAFADGAELKEMEILLHNEFKSKSFNKKLRKMK